MKYSAAVLSMAAAVAARPSFTNLNFDVQEGEPFTLEFTGCEGGCTINLKNGEENDLQDVQQITSNAEGGSFTFSLDALPSDTYTFEIVNNESGEDNYSQQFDFEGTGEPDTATTTVETETLTTSVPETTSSTPTTTEETSTETSTVEETTTVTSPSASTTASPTESTTASEDSTSTTDGAEATQTSEIPDPEGAAIALGSPMTFVVAVAAGLLMFN